MSEHLTRTGPEIPGLTTVDWHVCHIGYAIPASALHEDTWIGVAQRLAARIRDEARRAGRMVDEPATRMNAEGLLVYATVCGSPN